MLIMRCMPQHESENTTPSLSACEWPLLLHGSFGGFMTSTSRVCDVQVMSYGMVLCASDDAHGSVEPVAVPAGVPPGEKIQFEGYTGERNGRFY